MRCARSSFHAPAIRHSVCSAVGIHNGPRVGRPPVGLRDPTLGDGERRRGLGGVVTMRASRVYRSELWRTTGLPPETCWSRNRPVPWAGADQFLCMDGPRYFHRPRGERLAWAGGRPTERRTGRPRFSRPGSRTRIPAPAAIPILLVRQHVSGLPWDASTPGRSAVNAAERGVKASFNSPFKPHRSGEKVFCTWGTTMRTEMSG